MLIDMCNLGSMVIVGGGPGGRIPGGMLNSQPKMLMSKKSIQLEKNQRLQGISVPPSVALGAGTEVLTGNKNPAGIVVDEEVVEVVVGRGPGINVISTPSGSVIVVACVRPVGMVKPSPDSDTIVSPAELVVVTIGNPLEDDEDDDAVPGLKVKTDP